MMWHVSVLAFIALVGCASERVDVEELRARTQMECGTIAHAVTCDPDPDAAIACFLAAAVDCTPARVQVLQTYIDSGDSTELFVVPGSEGCDIIVFSKNADGFPPPGSTGMEETLVSCSAVSGAVTVADCSTIHASGCTSL